MKFLFLLSVSSFVFAAESRRDYPGEEQPVSYPPMKVSAAIALGLYSISTLIHWFRFFTLGQHLFMLTLTIGMTAMAGGFGLRLALALAGNRYSSGAAPMAFLILLSPYLFLALDYALLSRLAATFDEVVAIRCLLVRRTRIVPIFICSDIATFILQATGGILGTASTQTQLVDIGHKLSLVGLCLQLISFLFFTFILIIFGWRLSHEFPTHKEQHLRILSRDPIYDWRVLYRILCMMSSAILMRSVFLIAESATGYTGAEYPPSTHMHEGLFYGFDVLPLWIAMSMFCVVWPVRCIDHMRRSRDMDLSPTSSAMYV